MAGLEPHTLYCSILSPNLQVLVLVDRHLVNKYVCQG